MPAEDMRIELNEGGPNWHFSPGSEISGALIIKVQWAKKYDKVVVRLTGKADVRWEVRTNDSTTVYSASEEYVHEDCVVWTSANSADGEFPAGTSTFPFQFTLPSSLPASYSSQIGNITYTVEGVLYATYSHSRLPRVQREVKVLELASMDPSREPVSKQESKRVLTLCGSAVVNLTVEIPRPGYHTGDMIPVTVHVDNKSGRRLTVIGQLMEVVTYQGYTYSGRNLHTTGSLNGLSALYTEHIEPHSVQDVSFNVNLSGIGPAMKLSGIIKSYLMVRVALVIRWSKNIVVNIPISIANEAPTTAITAD